MIKKVITNASVFDGETLLESHAIVFGGGRVLELLPQDQLSEGLAIDCDLNGGFLVPGFVDLQVNGGGGVLFNNDPSVNALRIMSEAHRQYGTTGFLPTLITDSFDVMRKAILAVEQAIKEGVAGVLGIHLEGPFLNVSRKGAHDASKFCAIDEAGFEIITSLTLGKTLVTMAPELTTPAMISRIADAGVIVCAGHSGANYAQTCEALDAGVSGFTHLYNAMTPLESREPGMVGAALADDKSWFGIIADGYHMHPANFHIAVAAKRTGGAILVTDAMATVGAKEKTFELDGEVITAVDGRLTNAAGTLAGSDLDMAAAVKNAARFANIDWLEAVRMASVYPAKALGLQHQLGCIKPGCLANFVALDEQRQVVHTWIDGIKR